MNILSTVVGKKKSYQHLAYVWLTGSLKIWQPLEGCNYSGNDCHSDRSNKRCGKWVFHCHSIIGNYSFAHAPENVLEIEHAKGMWKICHCWKKKYIVTEFTRLNLLIMPQFLGPILNDSISNLFGCYSFSLQLNQYFPGLCPKAVECKLTIPQFPFTRLYSV